MTTVGAAGPLMCSVAPAEAEGDTLWFWSVWVAETVTLLPSPGLRKSTVTVPLL